MSNSTQCNNHLVIADEVSFTNARNACESNNTVLATDLDESQMCKSAFRNLNSTNLYWVGLQRTKLCAKRNNETARFFESVATGECVDIDTLPISKTFNSTTKCKNLVLETKPSFVLRDKINGECIRKAGSYCQKSLKPVKPSNNNATSHANVVTTNKVSTSKETTAVYSTTSEMANTRPNSLESPIIWKLTLTDVGALAGGIGACFILILLVVLIKSRCSSCKCKKKNRKFKRGKSFGLKTLQLHINDFHLKRSTRNIYNVENNLQSSTKSSIYIKTVETTPYVNYKVEEKISTDEVQESPYQNIDSSPYFELHDPLARKEEDNFDSVSESCVSSNRIYANVKERVYEIAEADDEALYENKAIKADSLNV